ncbi:GNAT family N-acetyltransferase [Serinicoccus sp. CUA-874]|uniref:GNAT family N-acetyltransferase n=1 Tax=Serinicoccus sp. CUA-874 TaxID=1517939 RepID=UPI0039E06843
MGAGRHGIRRGSGRRRRARLPRGPRRGRAGGLLHARAVAGRQPARPAPGLVAQRRPRAPGTGLAQELLRRALGEQAAYLWVAQGNHRAVRFYEQQGFALDGAQNLDGHEGVVELRMVRPS